MWNPGLRAGLVNNNVANAAPAAPRPWLDKLKDHVIENRLLYTTLGITAVGFGAALYLGYRQDRALQQKIMNDAKAEQKKNLELRTFNDTDFVDALNEFVEAGELAFKKEYALLINSIELRPIHSEEKKGLKGLIEKAFFSEQPDEECLQACYNVIKTKSALPPINRSYGLTMENEQQRLLQKASNQLFERMHLNTWKEFQNDAAELLKKLNSLEKRAKLTNAVGASVFLEHFINHYKTELQVLDQMHNDLPYEELIKNAVYAIASDYPHVSYVKMLETSQKNLTMIMATAHDAKAYAFQKETEEKAQKLSDGINRLIALVKQQPEYQQEIARREKKERKEKQQANIDELKAELKSIQEKLTKITRYPVGVHYRNDQIIGF